LPDRDTCHESGKRRELSFTRVRNCARQLQHLGGHAGADGGRLDLHAQHMNQPGQPCAEVREVFGDSRLRAHDSFTSIDWPGPLCTKANGLRRRPCAERGVYQEQAEQSRQYSDRQRQSERGADQSCRHPGDSDPTRCADIDVAVPIGA